MSSLSDLIYHFDFKGILVNSEPFGCGHINDTLKLTFKNEDGKTVRYILQTLNTSVFRDPDGLMNNILYLTEHIRSKVVKAGRDPERATLKIIPTIDGELYYKAPNGYCYRVYEFIENTISLESIENAEQFENLARIFGDFQNKLIFASF